MAQHGTLSFLEGYSLRPSHLCLYIFTLKDTKEQGEAGGVSRAYFSFAHSHLHPYMLLRL